MDLQNISTPYGARVALTIQIDAEDAENATLYVGRAGETPIITKTGAFTPVEPDEDADEDDPPMYEADVSLIAGETKRPLGTYKYQINVSYPNSDPDKFPGGDGCSYDELPEFKITEALDETEVS